MTEAEISTAMARAFASPQVANIIRTMVDGVVKPLNDRLNTLKAAQDNEAMALAHRASISSEFRGPVVITANPVRSLMASAKNAFQQRPQSFASETEALIATCRTPAGWALYQKFRESVVEAGAGKRKQFQTQRGR